MEYIPQLLENVVGVVEFIPQLLQHFALGPPNNLWKDYSDFINMEILMALQILLDK